MDDRLRRWFSLINKISDKYDQYLEEENKYFFKRYGNQWGEETTVNHFSEKLRIIELLFQEQYRTQSGWLETILHILKIENNETILDTVIKDMSDIDIGVFRTIYHTLVAKEMMNGLPKLEKENLQKLRASMVRRIEETNPIDFQRKISACLEEEVCQDIQIEIVAKIIGVQRESNVILPKISWWLIESLDHNCESFGIESDSDMKKATASLIELRNKIHTQ